MLAFEWSDAGTVQVLCDHRPIVCCAVCGRLKTRTGRWVATSGSVSKILHQGPLGSLSHGYCPECLARQFREFR